MKKLILVAGVALAVGFAGSAPAAEFKFHGDLNNRFMLYTDQAGMFSGSETVKKRTINEDRIDETWGEIKYRLWAEAATDDGIAMTLGIYDDANRKSILSRQIAVKDIRGDSYQTIDLGVHPLSEAMYVWAAPVVRKPEDVAAVYVDRVFLVRERRP